MQLLQAGKRGHDAGFVQLHFKGWNLIEGLSIRGHSRFRYGETVGYRVLVQTSRYLLHVDVYQARSQLVGREVIEAQSLVVIYFGESKLQYTRVQERDANPRFSGKEISSLCKGLIDSPLQTQVIHKEQCVEHQAQIPDNSREQQIPTYTRISIL